MRAVLGTLDANESLEADPRCLALMMVSGLLGPFISRYGGS